jgi:sulfate/thiosulfate transport system permease protein
MPLRIEKLYEEYNSTGAFAVSSVLALLALFTLAIKTFLEWKQARDYELAQHAVSEPDLTLTGPPPRSPSP